LTRYNTNMSVMDLFSGEAVTLSNQFCNKRLLP
jgi:hypothetical protein